GTGNYTVTMTDGNGCTSAASAPASVTVNPIPEAPVVNAGGPTTFCAGGSVTLTSSSTTGMQWYLNGAPISGQTAQTYVATASGDYSATVTTNGCTSALSNVTTVTVTQHPNATITAPAAVQTGTTGNIASVANAGAGATYNWSITNGTITGGVGTNRITFTAGAVGTLTLQVTVTSSSNCSDTKSANVNVTATSPALSITSVVPPAGKVTGGKAVTVNGTGFQTGATLTFGGVAATNVVVVNATKITARTPAHAAGAVDVKVTNPNASNATLTNGYTYVPTQFDANGDHVIDPSDIFYLVNYLYLHGPAPASRNSGASAQSVMQPMTGSIRLGEPVRRGTKFVIPVIVDSARAEAMSLRIVIPDELGVAKIRRTGSRQPLFEISRGTAGQLSYLASFDGKLSGVVAEIEISTAKESGTFAIEIDPAVTMLSNAAGTRKATFAAGTLQLQGAAIQHTKAERKE